MSALALTRKLALAAALACAPPAGAATLSPAQLKADLQLARKALEEAHGGIYRYASKQEFDTVFDAASRKLNHPMEVLAFLRILAPAVAAVRCGHTGVQLPSALRTELEAAPLLPLDVKIIGGKVFILRDFGSGGALAGSEILSINGVPAATIVATLTAASPGDGFIPTGRAGRVARSFKEGLLHYFGMQGRFMLTMTSPGSTPRQVTLAGQTLAALRDASARQYPQDQRPKKFIELSFPEEHIARLQVLTFMDDDEEDDGETLLAQAFDKIAASGASTLLLDLRNNGGGKDELGKRLYAHLVARPFTYYDALTVKRAGLSFASHVAGPAGIPADALQERSDGLFALRSHPNLGVQQNATPAFKGKVIALINGASFSTTAELISQLHNKGRAIFVGEESGGAYHGNNSGRDAVLVLPNSALKVTIPLVTYTLALDGSHVNGRGVVPQYAVTPSIADYLARRDPQLEQALLLARAGRQR